jgi:hypothetical protein
MAKTNTNQSGFPGYRERRDQTVSLVDDEHVEIKNAYGSKVISISRMIDLTWPDDLPLPMQEIYRVIDEEIASSN